MFSTNAQSRFAQKALEGSETDTRELLGGMEEKSVYPTTCHFLQKGNRPKLRWWPDLEGDLVEVADEAAALVEAVRSRVDLCSLLLPSSELVWI